ncbi:hypothetical protein NHJ13051_002610 [Beauveria bassiana]|nr:putative alpha-1,6-mannosyltransferase MNN10 [Beauveria bassiana D1-5]PMB69342.1 putative alpha-1,6-mannosyltransferase MNN10 [Beauveria bassiana]
MTLVANLVCVTRDEGTPSTNTPMSLSRSPSPVPAGGWSSPGLNINSGRSSPASSHSVRPVAWESKMRNGHPSFSSQHQGFFSRHMRRISSSLPRFTEDEKEKLMPSNSYMDKVPLVGRIKLIFGRMGRKLKLRLLIALFLLFCIWVFYNSPLIYWYRRAAWGGGGSKFVVVLAANVGGGVMEWKGAREWAIERDSIRNKRKYVARWGYDLEIVDMSTKKRYAHEWRESWEKVDFLRNAMRKYPDAEWFWWLDLNTIVMEPSYSLQDHIFNSLDKKTYRDINDYNPLNITHPFTEPYLEPESRSPVGDGNPNSVNLLLSQDCSGFNLGSFFVRRSAWTERLLDIWWDPVAYEQKHMAWEHKEQDALETMYESHPWVRQHTGFLPQRMINSFPPAACGDGTGNNHTRFHYHEKDRDFMVNMAGCEWGRDCWGEMYHYRQFSYWLNRNPWERFKEDFIAVIWYHLTGKHVRL